MYKTFIAGITAISLTLSSAAPAQANGYSEEDIGKFLFGLLATATVVGIINNQNNDTVAPTYVPPPAQVHTPRAPHVTPAHPRQPRATPQQPRTLGQWYNSGQRPSKVLPRACLNDVKTRYGAQKMFQRHCLRVNYRGFARLPAACAVRVISVNGPRYGWDPQCMRQRGYSASRR